MTCMQAGEYSDFKQAGSRWCVHFQAQQVRDNEVRQFNNRMAETFGRWRACVHSFQLPWKPTLGRFGDLEKKGQVLHFHLWLDRGQIKPSQVGTYCTPTIPRHERLGTTGKEPTIEKANLDESFIRRPCRTTRRDNEMRPPCHCARMAGCTLHWNERDDVEVCAKNCTIHSIQIPYNRQGYHERI